MQGGYTGGEVLGLPQHHLCHQSQGVRVRCHHFTRLHASTLLYPHGLRKEFLSTRAASVSELFLLCFFASQQQIHLPSISLLSDGTMYHVFGWVYLGRPRHLHSFHTSPCLLLTVLHFLLLTNGPVLLKSQASCREYKQRKPNVSTLPPPLYNPPSASASNNISMPKRNDVQRRRGVYRKPKHTRST